LRGRGGERTWPSTCRLIKKYPNRRLYDTQTSSYITLADVKELVLKTRIFQVVDAKSGEDLTRSILLQIILEEEAGGMPMFTSDLLSQMIRFYGNAMQGMMGKYLENNIKAFTDMQSKLQDQAAGHVRREQRRQARTCGRSSSTSRAGHAEHDGRLHGAVQEDVHADAGADRKPDAQHVLRLPVPQFRRRRPASPDERRAAREEVSAEAGPRKSKRLPAILPLRQNARKKAPPPPRRSASSPSAAPRPSSIPSTS
jgi:polyhydroxyalkanoate synthesis repressor PhaR